MVIKARKLVRGDKIGVLTISDALSENKLRIVQNGIERLEKMGFSIKKGKTLKTYAGLTAGTPKERAEDFMNMIVDKEIKAIFFAWGGENGSQILPLLDYNAIKLNPKILMGHSDPTVLLNTINKKTGLITFYGHFAASFDSNWEWFTKYDEDLFFELLGGQKKDLEIPPSEARETFRSGSCSGKIIGGCITDLVKLIGTPYCPNFKNKILILESYVIRPHELLAHLTHLKQTGIFNEIRGLLLGNFILDSTKSNVSLKDIFLSELSEYSFPILKTKDFGHNSHMFPVPIGANMYCEADSKKIMLTEDVVSS